MCNTWTLQKALHIGDIALKKSGFDDVGDESIELRLVRSIRLERSIEDVGDWFFNIAKVTNITKKVANIAVPENHTKHILYLKFGINILKIDMLCQSENVW